MERHKYEKYRKHERRTRKRTIEVNTSEYKEEEKKNNE